jgi:hypothetical protein
MHAAIDTDAAAKQRAIQDRMNALRTEMVETGDKMGMTAEEQAAINKKHTDRHRESLQQARDAFDKRFGEDKQQQLQSLGERLIDRKQNDTTQGLFGKLEYLPGVGGMFKHMNELSLPQNRRVTVDDVKNTPEYQREAAEINQRYEENFRQSREFRAYEQRRSRITAEHARENDAMNNRKELRQRGDVEGHKIDKMEQIAMQRVQMEAESKKMKLDAAMRLPVRSGLEESFNMLNDELIKQGEAQRLGVDKQPQVELTDKSLKPILERLDKMFQKLEDKLQTGVPVRVS